MLTVTEVSRLTGVSVRTLHHYDSIGLLKPAHVTAAGYRMYDEAALRRLSSILMLRELQFSLKEIKHILASPAFDMKQALEDQIILLTLQRARLDSLISLAREIQKNGVDSMNFDAFDRTGFDAYKAEAKTRWGDTAAYTQYEKREKAAGRPAMQAAGDGLMTIISEIAALRPLPSASPEAAAKVRDLQAYITANFYECTDEILAGLGQMYISDERFRKNIDRAAGDGAAEYVSAAIAACINA